MGKEKMGRIVSILISTREMKKLERMMRMRILILRPTSNGGKSMEMRSRLNGLRKNRGPLMRKVRPRKAKTRTMETKKMMTLTMIVRKRPNLRGDEK